MTDTVNIPLLRKAVEWAEAEAAKPPELCEWEQNYYSVDPHKHRIPISRPATGERITKAAECGTCYCIAGYVSVMAGKVATAENAQALLGLDDDDAYALFHFENTIEDVRRIAEDIAGERL